MPKSAPLPSGPLQSGPLSSAPLPSAPTSGFQFGSLPAFGQALAPGQIAPGQIAPGTLPAPLPAPFQFANGITPIKPMAGNNTMFGAESRSNTQTPEFLAPSPNQPFTNANVNRPNRKIAQMRRRRG